MKKIIWVLLLMILAVPYTVFAQDAEQSKEPWVWTNGLGYGPQYLQNIERGSNEIVQAPSRIEPSTKEYEHTKTGVPGLDQFFTGVLMLTNVTDSMCRGAWRLIVAPFPIVQKIQP